MADETEAAAVESDDSPAQRAVLFELENVAVKGRQVVFDVLGSVLADKGIKLTPAMFSRHCHESSLKQFLPALLASEGRTRLSEDKLQEEIAEGIRLSLTGGSPKIESGLASVLDKAKKKGVLIGALTGLEEETAGQLTQKLGLSDAGIHMLSQVSEEKTFPSADAWLKLAKNMAVLPQLCMVIATSSTGTARSASR